LANSALKIGKTQNDGAWWIINETSQNVDLDSRELFGFNVGSFAEVPTGPFPELMVQKHDIRNSCHPFCPSLSLSVPEQEMLPPWWIKLRGLLAPTWM